MNCPTTNRKLVRSSAIYRTLRNYRTNDTVYAFKARRKASNNTRACWSPVSPTTDCTPSDCTPTAPGAPQWTAGAGTCTLSPNTNDTTENFTYQYSRTNSNQGWQTANSTHTKTFSRLNVGNHTFTARRTHADNSCLDYSSQSPTVTCTVTTPPPPSSYGPSYYTPTGYGSSPSGYSPSGYAITYDCSSTVINNCVLPNANIGGTGGTCDSCYSGSCSYECTSTGWSAISNTCSIDSASSPAPTCGSSSGSCSEGHLQRRSETKSCSGSSKVESWTCANCSGQTTSCSVSTPCGIYGCTNGRCVTCNYPGTCVNTEPVCTSEGNVRQCSDSTLNGQPCRRYTGTNCGGAGCTDGVCEECDGPPAGSPETCSLCISGNCHRHECLGCHDIADDHSPNEGFCDDPYEECNCSRTEDQPKCITNGVGNPAYSRPICNAVCGCGTDVEQCGNRDEYGCNDQTGCYSLDDSPPPGYAPSGYSPSGYSPSGYSPSGYSPSGYSPSGYSPSGSWCNSCSTPPCHRHDGRGCHNSSDAH